jgi:FKBP-type peptidyl-prolyl cis-trans isomerase FkpA
MNPRILLCLLAALACSEGGSVGTADSGLEIIHVTVGTGDSPGPRDTVTVHYHGTLEDGTVFGSSVQQGQPASFPLNRVIACWTQGVQTMKVGGKAKLVCPAEIAYGENGRPPKIPPNTTLYFDVELIEIVDPLR